MVGQTLERTGLVDELRRRTPAQPTSGRLRAPAGERALRRRDPGASAPTAPLVGAAVIDMVLLADGRTVAGTERTDGPGLLTDGTGASAARRWWNPPGCLRQREMVTLGRAPSGRLPAPMVGSSPRRHRARRLFPLGRPRWSRLGVVALGWPGPPDLTPTVVAKLRTVAELCSQACSGPVSRSRASDWWWALRAGRPPVPAPGLLTPSATCPQPNRWGWAATGSGRRVGGRAVRRDHRRHRRSRHQRRGRHGRAPGDHRIDAAGAARRSRRCTPGGRCWCSRAGGGLTATSCTAVFDTSDDTVRYVSAGHLPVLARPDGSVELLEQGRQPLLGVAGSIVAPGVARSSRARRSCCTPTASWNDDGSRSTSRSNLRVATAELVRTIHPGAGIAAPAQDDVERFTGALLRSCLGERSTDDDVALVVVTRADRIATGR